MAVRLTVNGATVTVGPDTYTKALLSARGGRASFRTSSGQALAKDGLLSVTSERDANVRRYALTFEDGSTWAASRDCGCGGRR